VEKIQHYIKCNYSLNNTNSSFLARSARLR